MRSQTRTYIVLGVLFLGVALSAGCFGPFKKKSGGGGGGGAVPAAEIEESVSDKEPPSTKPPTKV